MTDLVIRELRPADRHVLVFVFAHLGHESRVRRFHTVKRELTPAELDGLTAVDGWHACALVAWSPVPRAPVGVARYVRGERFDVAELAVAVADDWQRHGVGTALVLALRDHATRAGIRRFTGPVLADNRAALALVRRLGPDVVVRAHAGVADVSAGWRGPREP